MATDRPLLSVETNGRKTTANNTKEMHMGAWIRIAMLAATLSFSAAANARSAPLTVGIAQKLTRDGLLTHADSARIALARKAVRACLRLPAGVADRLTRCESPRLALLHTRMEVLQRLRAEVKEPALERILEDRIQRTQARLSKIEHPR